MSKQVTQRQVLIDTCVWITFFRNPKSLAVRDIRPLAVLDRIVTVGPVMAEVLMGFRREAEANWANAQFGGVKYLQLTREHWRVAARLYREQKALGNELPLTDLVVVAAALDKNLEVFTTDPHFDLFPTLLRFQPT